MSDTQLEQGVNAGEAALDRFSAVRELGRVAAELRSQAVKVEASIDYVAGEDYVAPEGESIVVGTKLKEDPLTVEVCVASYLDEEQLSWTQVTTSSYRYETVVDTIDSSPRFFGQSIGYDKDDGKIWVYNARRSARVEYRNGNTLRLTSYGGQD